jgi:hypothetical protein
MCTKGLDTNWRHGCLKIWDWKNCNDKPTLQ